MIEHWGPAYLPVTCRAHGQRQPILCERAIQNRGEGGAEDIESALRTALGGTTNYEPL